MKTSIPTQVALFPSDATRIEYARRVTAAMLSAFQRTPALVEDALLRGRIGLAQMSDEMLIETGAAWGVAVPANVAVTRHQPLPQRIARPTTGALLAA